MGAKFCRPRSSRQSQNPTRYPAPQLLPAKGFSRSRSPRDLLRHAEHGTSYQQMKMSHPAPKKAQVAPITHARHLFCCRAKRLPPKPRPFDAE